MKWLNSAVDEVVAHRPEGEIIIETGSAPSGPYHFGHLREIITADAILKELLHRGHKAKHIHFVDDFDALRKIPVGIPDDYKKYLGQPLADIPGPGTQDSYGTHFLQGFVSSAKKLGINMEVVSGRQRYREGLFVEAIETALEQADKIRTILEQVSGHKLEDTWSPIQVMEDEYLKKRPFIKLDKQQKIIYFSDKDGQQQSVKYDDGKVKLDWRIDWPARWHILNVALEPSGRDHATKGGSIDTGMAIQRQVFGSEPPLQVGYDFVNLAGDTKKMSASKGTGVAADQVMQILPPEIVRFFMLKHPPRKRLYFDPAHVAKLIDDYATLLAKSEKSDDDKQLLEICSVGTDSMVGSIPFSHLVESYQAALCNPVKTLEILGRTEYREAASRETDTIKRELDFIDGWLEKWAPDDAKFELVSKIDASQFSDVEMGYLSALAGEVAKLPADADGESFHKTIYGVKESRELTPEQLFVPLYRALIGKPSGPRAGWFLSMLPRDWLLKRLRLEA